MKRFWEYISEETLAVVLLPTAPDGVEMIDVVIGDHKAQIGVRVVK